MRPLSSGLEIVRKCLGQHEIAVVQTTGIDQEAGLNQTDHGAGAFLRRMDVVRLAGVSGHRDGRATPHGRRPHLCPALCAVHAGGIAGEDDLDAPDLPTSSWRHSRAQERAGHAGRQTMDTTGRSAKAMSLAAKPILATEASAAHREELLPEIAALASSDQIDGWAFRGLPAKNTLRATDAQLVEDAFREKLLELG